MVVFLYALAYQSCIFIDGADSSDSVPLTDISVDVDVVGTSVQANYTLTYVNNQKHDLVEAKLKFPFDTDVAVSDVTLEYRERTIIAQIMKKENAKAVYTEAKENKDVAMLVTRQGDFLSLDLAGLSPNETFVAKINTHSILDLKFDNKKEQFFAQYVFPTSIVPRYSSSAPLPDLLADHQELRNSENVVSAPKTQEAVPYIFHFRLVSHSGEISGSSIEKSANTMITTDPNSGVSTLTYSGEMPFGVSVNIVNHVPQKKAATTVEVFDSDGKKSVLTEFDISGYTLDEFKILSKEEQEVPSYVFLIDRSGSMSGKDIKNAKEALEMFLHSLPPKCKFEIIGFGSGYHELFGKLVDYSDQSLEKALNHVATIDANLGGTEILAPLQKILPKHPKYVFLLTDGAVDNQKEVLAYVKLFDTKIYTIGIGSWASQDLLKTIARSTGGFNELISSSSETESAVIRLLKQTTSSIWVTGVSSTCGRLMQTFPFSLSTDTVTPLRFLSNVDRLSQKCEVNIEGSFGTKSVSITLRETEKARRISGKILHSAALLRALNEKVITEEEGFEHSIRLNLMTKSTSFVLVDKRSQEEKVNLHLKTVEIPIKMNGFGARSSMKDNANLHRKRQSEPAPSWFGEMTIPTFPPSKSSMTELPKPRITSLEKMEIDDNEEEEMDGGLIGDMNDDLTLEQMHAGKKEEGENQQIYTLHGKRTRQQKQTIESRSEKRDLDDVCRQLSKAQKANGDWMLKEVLAILHIDMNALEGFERWKQMESFIASCLASLFMEMRCGINYGMMWKKGFIWVQNQVNADILFQGKRYAKEIIDNIQ